MGQICLVVRGVQVHSVTGDLAAVSTARKCKRFGFDVRLATADRVFLREWTPGPRDPIGPVAEVAVHEVGGALAQGHGANTLLVRIGSRWNREVAASLREGLGNSRRRDAGLVVLVLFRDGGLMNAKPKLLSELRELAAELEAPLVVNEDVGGSWSRALRMESDESSSGEVEWRLISPTGGITWAHSGPADPHELTRVLDDYLFRSPIAGVAQIAPGLAQGSRVSPDILVDRLSDHLSNELNDQLIEIESTCPPPPFGRLGVHSVVTFATINSAASESAIRKLASENENREIETFAAVVFDGAGAEEIEQLRRSLPDGVVAIPDRDGVISNRFGIRVWPSNVTINESGVVTAFELGLDTRIDVQDSEEAS